MEKEILREKIAEIIAQMSETDYSKIDMADEILALVNKELLKNVEVEEECKNCDTTNFKKLVHSELSKHIKIIDCPKCKGTGKIRRPAKLEDIDLKRLIMGYEIMADKGYLQTVKEAKFIAKDFLKKIPSGGRLVIKEEK